VQEKLRYRLTADPTDLVFESVQDLILLGGGHTAARKPLAFNDYAQMPRELGALLKKTAVLSSCD
jgi:hypothetical protein